MFCPQCGIEYRDGFTRCSDCGVTLVEGRPKLDRGSAAGSHGQILNVWKGTDQDECVSICERLRSAGVPFRVHQHRQQYFKDVDCSFEIEVPVEFRAKAKEEISEYHPESQLEWSDDDEGERLMGLPAQEVGSPDDDRDAAPQPAPGSDDAGAEVEFEVTAYERWMVEASLRENDIRARVETSGNGIVKILVMQRDAPKAREIIREIKDGAPPK